MRTRTTLLLLIAAAASGAAVWKLEEHVPSTRTLALEAANPLPFNSASVDGIEIEASEASITFRVEDRLWRAAKPINDVVDPESITALVQSLSQAEWLEHLPADEMSSETEKMTGLKKPFAHVKLTSAGTLVAECWVGNASAIDGAFYLALPGKKEGKRETYVVRTQLPVMLKKPLETWRDERLLRVPAESVSRILISSAKGQIEVARDKPKQPWDLVKPLQTRGHNERINEMLAALLGLKIAAVDTTDLTTAPPADALKFTLVTPAFERPVELTIDMPADVKTGKAIARSSHRTSTFAVTSDQLATLTLQLNDLRDDRLARVDVSKVDALAVKSAAAGEIALRKEGDNWVLQRHGEWEPANGDRVAKMFEALNEHRVKEFVADSAANLQPYGLDKPFLTVAWNEAGDKPDVKDAALSTPNKGFVVSPLVGTDTALLFGQDAQGNVFAKYESDLFVYRVGASVLYALPRDNVRWKALTPMRFSQFSLRQIQISVGTNPPVTLDYDPISAVWKGTRAGEDITSLIDRVKADRLVGKLGGLVVDDWAQDRTDGTKALQTPAITIQITLISELGNSNSPNKLITLNLAPTVANTDTALYFGRINEGPDIFMLTRDTLRDLLQSVLK